MSEAGNGVRQNPARRFTLLCFRIDVGAALDKKPDDVGMVIAHGEHQRRLLEGAIAGIDNGATIQKNLDRVEIADACGGHQCRLSRCIDGIGIGARIQQ